MGSGRRSLIFDVARFRPAALAKLALSPYPLSSVRDSRAGAPASCRHLHGEGVLQSPETCQVPPRPATRPAPPRPAAANAAANTITS
jgi:hypothetical protein